MEVPEDYRQLISDEIDRQFYYSTLVLDRDYYRLVLDRDDTASASGPGAGDS